MITGSPTVVSDDFVTVLDPVVVGETIVADPAIVQDLSTPSPTVLPAAVLTDFTGMTPVVMDDFSAQPSVVLSDFIALDPVTVRAGVGGNSALWTGYGEPQTIIGSKPGDEYVDLVTGFLYTLS